MRGKKTLGRETTREKAREIIGRSVQCTQPRRWGEGLQDQEVAITTAPWWFSPPMRALSRSSHMKALPSVWRALLSFPPSLLYFSPSLYPCALPHGDCEESRRGSVFVWATEHFNRQWNGEKQTSASPLCLHTCTHTQTFSLFSSVSTSAMCFLNPAMLVKVWGRFSRCSYPITAVLSQMLRARWVSLSAAYGVGSYAIHTVPLDPRHRCLLEGVGAKHT